MCPKAARVALLAVVLSITRVAGQGDTWSDAASVCWNAKLERYVYQALNTFGCPQDARAIVADSGCEAAAQSLSAAYQGKQRDSGAPTGCFYLTGDDGAVRAVVWNTINTQEDTYSDAANLCFELASQQYVYAALNSHGCPSGLERIRNATACGSAAASFSLPYEGSARSGGVPSGCWYVADGAVAGKLTAVGWNTLGQAPTPAPSLGAQGVNRRLQGGYFLA